METANEIETNDLKFMCLSIILGLNIWFYDRVLFVLRPYIRINEKNGCKLTNEEKGIVVY